MAIGCPDPSRAYRGDMPLVDTVHKIWRGLRISVSGHATFAAIQLRLFEGDGYAHNKPQRASGPKAHRIEMMVRSLTGNSYQVLRQPAAFSLGQIGHLLRRPVTFGT